MKTYSRAVAAGLAALALGGMALAAPKTGHTVHTGQPGPSYGVTLGIDKMTYMAADTKIHADLTLFNRSPVPLVYYEHGRRYEWQILDRQRNVVWNYGTGRMFSHLVMRRSLVSGQADYACDVPLTTQAGQPLSPGVYTLRGQLFSPPLAGEVGFTVTK